MPRRPAFMQKMQPIVFFGSAFVVVAFVIFGAGFTSTAATWFEATRSRLAELFGWHYMLTATAMLIFAIWAMLGPLGRIRLGPDDAEPEFGRLSWFAMLFAAGMGIGLVFWSVAEPLTHYVQPLAAEPRSDEALRQALRYTFFHWGLHPWAIYIILGMALAYFHFRRNLPLAPRSILYPLIGERMHGPIGHGVDILCTVGTLLGVATSLGLGAMQINTGISRIAGVPNATYVQLIIIAVITAVATVSVVVGVHSGVRRLSQINIILAAILLVFVFIAGPTVYMLDTFVSGLGLYLVELPKLSFWLDLSVRGNSEWQASWTLFYWGWWISWSPFVGVFVARISKGRTIREFVLGVLLVPTAVTFLWLAVFSGSALYFEQFGDGTGIAAIVQDKPAVALHRLLDYLPFGTIAAAFATLVVIIFFITSSDSGSLVDDMVTSGGHPNPPRPQRVFWATSEGAVAATLLVAGGLSAMQNASISAGLPMSLVLITTCVSLWRVSREEQRRAEVTVAR